MHLWPLALLAMSAGAAELKIDHVTVAGKDLSAMRARLAALGIQSDDGGAHNNRATRMALVSFPDGSYLELIAPQEHSDPAALAAHSWSRFMAADAGPCAWAAQTKDLQAELARLAAAGVATGRPERGGRDRPDGRRLEWETAAVGKEAAGSFFPFLIWDITPRRDRAFPVGKPTTKDFSGIRKVVIAVRDLEESVKRYRAAYGVPPPIGQVNANFGAHLSLLGGVPVILAAPLNSQSWLADRLEQFGEGPCAFILEAQRAGRYKPASTSRWFGGDVSWFDSEQLGWRLGYQ
jgi:hypothetical protein